MAALAAALLLLALILVFPFSITLSILVSASPEALEIRLTVGRIRRRFRFPPWPQLEELPESPRRAPPVDPRVLAELAREVSRRLLLRRLRWTSMAGLGGARTTALGAGLIWTGKSLTLAALDNLTHLSGRPQVSVRPVFDRTGLYTHLRCIASFRLGDIIIALASFFAGLAWRKGVAFRWPQTKTLSRAS